MMDGRFDQHFLEIFSKEEGLGAHRSLVPLFLLTGLPMLLAVVALLQGG